MADCYTENEKNAIQELKRRMEGAMEKEKYEDDNMFYKFLKARDFKVENAERMLRQHLKWRQKYDVENICKFKPKEVMEKYLILDFICFDKEGCLVKYNHFGNTDFRGLIESTTYEEWIKSYILYFENDLQMLKNQSKKLGRTVDKVIYIENLENFTLSKATDRKVLSRMITMIHMYLDNYPETLKAAYTINTPVAFNLFFSVLKAFLPSTVVSKLHIYTDDSWRKDLLEVIDADVLPAFLGGKRTDPDGNPLCRTLIRDSLSVPTHYYMRHHKESFTNSSDVEKIIIPRASNHEIHLEVREPESHLEWDFQIKSADIKFGILYQDKSGLKTEVVPIQRVNADEYNETGVYKCENTGTYVVVFDNRYSYFRPKEIYYKIKINKPHGVRQTKTYELSE